MIPETSPTPDEATGGRGRVPPVSVLAGTELAPLFWPAARSGVDSAWYGHVAFAHWLVSAARPRVIVELGAHAGVSYGAFCEAVARQNMDTQCFAIDTWCGDAHAGYYNETVFESISEYNAAHYGGFSQLLRRTFDEALPYFADASIDLLHVDGLHSYEAVRHDFSSWLPKLSDRAVVLFHDINVREHDFGVWQLWAELSPHYPHFEFLHAHGLGVLAVGVTVPDAVAALCSLRDPSAVNAIRDRFARLGTNFVQAEEIRFLKARHAALDGEFRKLTDHADVLTDERDRVRSRLAEIDARLREAENKLRASDARATDLAARLREAQAETGRLQATLGVVLNSTSWRAAGVLRAVGRRVPHGVRQWLRQTGRATALPAVALRQGDPRVNSPVAPASLGPRGNLQGGQVNGHMPFALPGCSRQLDRRTGLRMLWIAGEPDTPGVLYRVVRMVACARAAGASADWLRADEIATRLDGIADIDVLVIWRAPWDDAIASAVERGRRSGARIIFDVDDLMFEPDLARSGIIDGIRSQALVEPDVAAYYGRIRATAGAADACSCTTAELATHLRHLGKPAFVLPNGFDEAALAASRLALRRHRGAQQSAPVRIGYAGGTRTHQKDFAQAADAIAAVLAERPECRLVLFRSPVGPLLQIDEFPALAALHPQIEWRDAVPLEDLPAELARFDINLAPVEVGNAYCEAKSELKYVEAALVEVCTLASPTGPFRRAIRDGETGFLASGAQEWRARLLQLIADPVLRRRVGQSAFHDVLWRFGPQRRTAAIAALVDQLHDADAGAGAFELELARAARPPCLPHVPQTAVAWASDNMGSAAITVVVPLYNYADYVAEALDSVACQSLQMLDLIVVDDRSTDASADIVHAWLEHHRSRFNRAMLLRNENNCGLGLTRNAGFAAAETAFVLPLDADNRLLPDCAAACLDAISGSGAAFAYPMIAQFGDANNIVNDQGFAPIRFAGGNYIDAMALISKAAWAAVGGYDHVRFGWEDYDFWCRFVEHGFWGRHVPQVLAEYRVHGRSMLRTVTEIDANKRRLVADIEDRHKWLQVAAFETAR